jgi:hypothetical protein
MPFLAEFTTDGRFKMLDSGHAPDEDKDGVQKFEKHAIVMAEARRCPVHLQVLHNDRVVHSKKAMVTLITASSRERPATYSKIAHRHHDCDCHP